MNSRPTYSRQVIEIADFIYKYPDKKMSDVLSYFVGKCRKNKRTIERYAKQAKAYNEIRFQKTEQARDEALTAEAKETIKLAILSRSEALKILSDIASGKARKIEKNILAPTDGERTKAIQQLSKMEGWDAPLKSELTGANGCPLNPEPLKIEIIDSRDQINRDAENTDKQNIQ